MPTSSTLLPREHGAWVQLALPLVGALAAGRPNGAALALALGVALAFLAHEPLLVLRGRRGALARERDGHRARRRLLALALPAAASFIAGLALAPPASRLAALPLAALAALALLLGLRRGERSTAFEAAVAVALGATAPMVALAAGASERVALLHGLFWSTTFAAETLAARGVLAMAKKRAPSRRLLAVATAVAALGLAAAIAAVAAGLAGPALAWAAAPAVPICAATWWRPPQARRLFTVGVAMAVAGTASLVALLAGPL